MKLKSFYPLFVLVVTILFLFLTPNVYAQYTSESKAEESFSNLDRAFFIENKGQWPEEVLYLTRIGGLDAWITKSGVVYDFYKMKEVEKSVVYGMDEVVLPGKEEKEYSRYGQVVRMELNKPELPALKPGSKKSGVYNYFIGNDQSKWARNVGLYKEVRLQDIYEGIRYPS